MASAGNSVFAAQIVSNGPMATKIIMNTRARRIVDAFIGTPE
jgi:hypothetical protein